MSDPLIITIPPGTTQLDLRPILVPIVRALIDRSRDRLAGPCTLGVIDAWIASAYETHEFHERTARLRSEWFVAYMTTLQSSGWHRSYSSGVPWDKDGAFEKAKPRPEPRGSYYDNQFMVRLPPSTDPARQLAEFVKSLQQLREAEGLPTSVILDRIESFGNPVDRLAALATSR